MRRTRRLTSGERWELGLFLAMLIVACLCFTAILNLKGIPRLFAYAFHSDDNAAADDSAAPAPRVPPAPLLATSAPVAQLQATMQLPQQQAPVPVPSVLTPQVQLAPPPIRQPIRPRIEHKRPAPEIKWYHGAKYRFVKTLRLRVTAYAPDERCCWPYPGTTTASGLSVHTNHGRLVAADTRLIPMHALVAVPGYSGGAAVPVLDRGGAIKGHRLDVLMPTFSQAKEWGSRTLEVKVYLPVDDED